MNQDEKLRSEYYHQKDLESRKEFEHRMNLLFSGCNIGDVQQIKVHENPFETEFEETYIEVVYLGGNSQFINCSINSLEADLAEIANLIHYGGDSCHGLIKSPEAVQFIREQLKEKEGESHEIVR